MRDLETDRGQDLATIAPPKKTDTLFVIVSVATRLLNVHDKSGSRGILVLQAKYPSAIPTTSLAGMSHNLIDQIVLFLIEVGTNL